MNEHFYLFSMEGEQHFVHGIVEFTVEWGGETIKKMRNITLYANKRWKALGGSQSFGGKLSLPVPKPVQCCPCGRCDHEF